jgi:hypothetical protein
MFRFRAVIATQATLQVDDNFFNSAGLRLAHGDYP